MISRVPDLQPFPHGALARLAAIPVLLLSVGVGISLVSQPRLAVLPLGMLVSAVLLIDGRARLAVVVFGGLFFFQRPGGLDMPKLALLGAFVVAFAGALLNVSKLRRTAAYEAAGPLLAASYAFAALGVFGLAVAYAGHGSLVDAVRDAAPYLLFATTPIFAIDAQATLSRTALVRVLAAAGTVATIAFAVMWLQRRGIAYLPIARVGVATLFVPAALFSYAMSMVLQATGRRARWLLLAAAVFALLVATGTRTTVALLVAPLAIVAASRRHVATRSFRLALLAPIAVAVTVVFAVALVQLTDADTDFLQQRFSLLRSTGDSASDASFNDRREQGGVAWAAFRSSPLFGVGPGYPFEWTPQGLAPRRDFVMDTPLTFPAKFGLVGLAVLLFVLTRFWSFVARLGGGVPPRTWYLALVGYLGVVVVLSAFAPPFEDKGFSYGLILLLAIVLASVREPSGSLLPESSTRASP
jgi:hypothetical protein